MHRRTKRTECHSQLDHGMETWDRPEEKLLFTEHPAERPRGSQAAQAHPDSPSWKRRSALPTGPSYL